MDRMSDNLTGWALAATGVMLAVAAVVTVIVLSAPTAASGDGARVAPRPSLAAARSRSGPMTISARRTRVGTILVGPGREVLYAFSRDRRNRDMCARIGGCLAIWPMVTVHGRLRARHGVRRSRLSTITVHGRRQVTYAGHPLYLYAAEPHGTSTDYVNVSEAGGRWPAVSPRGGLVR